MIAPTHKKCIKCGEIKSAADFVIRRKAKDGLYTYCKNCSKTSIAACKRANPARTREVSRRSRERRAEKVAKAHKQWHEAGREWMKNNPEKRKAQKAVTDAVRSGKIPRVTSMKCKMCGNAAKEYHHDDYSKPLDVVPLCVSCHRTITRNRLSVQP